MINIKKLLGLEMYVSELDRFLNEYKTNNPTPSASQQQEINTHKTISAKRDHESTATPTTKSIINQFLD